MFDKLDNVERRFEELTARLNSLELNLKNVLVQTKNAIPARELKILDQDAVLGRVLFL